MSGRRRWLTAGLTVGLLTLLALAAVGHGLYWYAPRERPGRLEPTSSAGRLLLDEDFEYALWLAHPHQNLGALREGLEAVGGSIDAAAWLGAAATWLGATARGGTVRGGTARWAVDDANRRPAGGLRWPGFGPFPVPPASELAVALGGVEEGGAGERASGAAVARIYPTWALVAKLAGRLAGNPWLAGGPGERGRVEAFGGTARVRWEGRDWFLERHLEREGGSRVGLAEEIPGGPSPAPPRAPALAWLRLGAGAGIPPVGLFRLHRPPEAPRDLELRRWRQGPSGVASAVLRPAFGSAEERFSDEGVVIALRQGAGTLVVFVGRLREDGLEMPPAAVLVPPGAATADAAERPRLPQEALPSFLRGDFATATEAGWRIVASGPEGLKRARRLAPSLPSPPPVLPPPAPCPALWVDLEAAHRFVDRVAGVLEEVPLVPRREVRRWRDGERLLAGLEGFRRLRVLCSVDVDPSTGAAADWALRWEARIDNPPTVP